jgi:hypothetical protein
MGWDELSGLSVSILFLIPEAEADVLVAVGVGDAGDTILAPAESSRSCVIVRKI